MLICSGMKNRTAPQNVGTVRETLKYYPKNFGTALKMTARTVS